MFHRLTNPINSDIIQTPIQDTNLFRNHLKEKPKKLGSMGVPWGFHGGSMGAVIRQTSSLKLQASSQQSCIDGRERPAAGA